MKRFLKKNYILIILIIGVLMPLYAVLSDAVSFYSGRKGLSYRSVEFDNNWNVNGRKLKSLNSVRLFKTDDENGSVMLYKQMPEDAQPNERLMFISRYCDFRVYVNGEFVYGYEPSKDSNSGSVYGSKFNIIDLGKNARGGMVMIILSPYYDKRPAAISNMEYGNSGIYIDKAVRRNFPLFLDSMVCFFMAVYFLVLSMGCENNSRDRMGFISLAIITACEGFWLSLESDIITMLLNYVLLSDVMMTFLLEISLMMSFVYVTGFVYATGFAYEIGTYRKISRVTTSVMLFLVALSALYIKITNLYLENFTGFFNILSAILLILDAYMIFGRGLKKKGSAFFFNYPWLFIGYINAVLEIFYMNNFIMNGITHSKRYITLFYGTVFAVCAVGIVLSYDKKVRNLNLMAARAEAYEKMAYTDALTGLENRGAFFKKADELIDMVDNGRSSGFLIANIDLNDLKKANDSLGHEFGDLYIKSAGSVLKETFKETGYVFRTGGDEFLVLCPYENLSSDLLKQNEKEIRRRLKSCQEEALREEPSLKGYFAIAMGFAGYDNSYEGPVLSLDTGKTHEERLIKVMKKADEDMYEHKNKMKK